MMFPYFFTHSSSKSSTQMSYLNVQTHHIKPIINTHHILDDTVRISFLMQKMDPILNFLNLANIRWELAQYLVLR